MQSSQLPCFEAVFTCLIWKLNLRLIVTYLASDTARFTCLGDLKAKKKTCHLFANMWKCIISVLVLVNFIEEEEGNMFQDEVFVRDG